MSVRKPMEKPAANGAVNRLPAQENVGIVIEPIQPKIIELEIVGITPLLVCAWSEKAIRMMLDKQMKKAAKGREAKNPEESYNSSRYISTEGWDGVPAGGIKGCLVNACRSVDGLHMTLAKRMVFVRSQGKTNDGQQLVRIYGTSKMHRAMVRLESGVADVRFRAIYEEWSMKLQIEFLADLISAEQVANLVNRAGYVEGLCEHRPGAPKSCTGDSGRFQIRASE